MREIGYSELPITATGLLPAIFRAVFISNRAAGSSPSSLVCSRRSPAGPATPPLACSSGGRRPRPEPRAPVGPDGRARGRAVEKAALKHGWAARAARPSGWLENKARKVRRVAMTMPEFGARRPAFAERGAEQLRSEPGRRRFGGTELRGREESLRLCG